MAAAAVQPKPRRLANLVTSWGPGVSKLKKLASGQGGAATATLPAKTRTSPRVPPSLPPKSDYVVQQQQSGELVNISTIGFPIRFLNSCV